MSVLQDIMKTQFHDDKLLNSLNKKMRHLNRVKKLKDDQKKNNKLMSHEMEATTRSFIDSLLNMCDPYIRDRFNTYK